MPQDTIAAVATPAGSGGVGVVRISGADLAPLLPVLAAPQLPPPRRAVRRQFVEEDGSLIDEGLVLYFPAPHSFTGEAVLELHAHGGAVVMQRLLARCVQCGARLAAPGEFTLRAYLNEKLDLAQAEALADLINAGSVAAARAAARSLSGAFSAAVAQVQAQLRRVRVAVESDLDFSDDDALTPDAAAAAGEVAALAAALDALLQQAEVGARLTAGVEVVVAGAPNVGKSSLLNALAGEEAAIVSDAPGTTRDLIERQVVVDGLTLRLTDTAGLRETQAAVEQEGIRRARARLTQADVVLLLSTADTLPPPLPPLQAVVLPVVNKIDLSGAAAGEREGVCHISATSGAGLPALRAALCAAAGVTPHEAPFSARARHLAALKAAQGYVQQALAAPPEVCAAWLRDADAQLQSITGTYDEEDLLGDIFSSFCVGK